MKKDKLPISFMDHLRQAEARIVEDEIRPQIRATLRADAYAERTLPLDEIDDVESQKFLDRLNHVLRQDLARFVYDDTHEKLRTLRGALERSEIVGDALPSYVWEALDDLRKSMEV